MISFAKLRFQWLNDFMKNFVSKKNDVQSQLKSEEKKFEEIKIADINILLNRVKLNKKSEIRKKFYFSTATALGLVLFGIVIF
tara:strand:- start:123 stop:371 length:249 start_codon:yes stop_codon:yes gene_type:complete